MKILIVDFEIAKYGGIVEHVESKVKAFKLLGHEVDIIQLSPASITPARYAKEFAELESGKFQTKQSLNSQNGGYEKSESTGYYKNNYYGFFLPPSNRIGVFEPNALERWHSVTKNTDLIIWNFMPTKSSAWNKADFSFWWKFYDLDIDRTKQIFISHDAYFDVRASNITALREKILYIECAHIAAYRCCENIGMPRTLMLNPRFLKPEGKMPVKLFKNRKNDFFAAHIFKSMKHMEDLIRSVPYFNHEVWSLKESYNSTNYSVKIAGSGIEQAYMVAPVKIKPNYVCTLKTDPDLPKKLDGQISAWNRAVNHGMEYLGQINGKRVNDLLFNTKFAVDPSWCTHYAKYCKTHINGFIIEAMLQGCYPVLRDYSGLVKDTEEIYDPLFDNIKAVMIPWNATPKQFANHLKKAMQKMTDGQYLKDTKHNFDLVYELFNAVKNAEETIRLVKGGKKLIRKELEIGKDSENVKKITKEIMEDFYHISLPIEWETD